MPSKLTPKALKGRERRQTLLKKAAVREVAARARGEVRYTKPLAQITQQRHDRLLKDWEDYTADSANGTGVTITSDTSLPSIGELRGFIIWLLTTRPGRIGPSLNRKTLHSYKHSTLSVWERRTGREFSRLDRKHINDFINSQDLKDSMGVSTTTREKAITHVLDVKLLTEAYLAEGSKYLRTVRMQLQLVWLTSFLAIGGNRPGSEIVSSAVRGTNEASIWSDHSVVIAPLKEHPFRPRVFILVKTHLLKNGRQDDAKWRAALLRPEPPEFRSMCPVWAFLTMACMDNAFADVSSASQIFSPSKPPTRTHVLRWHPENANRPICRREVIVEGQGWRISESQAMTCEMFNRTLQRFAAHCGFPNRLTSYCLRRMAGNNFHELLSENDASLLMSQVATSDTWATNYRPNTSCVDLNNVLHGLAPDKGIVKTYREVMSMSTRADPMAPIMLSVERRNEILRDSHLVALRASKQEAEDQIGRLNKALRSTAKKTSASSRRRVRKQDIYAELDALKARVHRIQSEHDSLLRRETEIQATAQRDEYFANASLREIRDDDHTGQLRIPLVTRRSADDAGRSERNSAKSSAILENMRMLATENPFMLALQAIHNVVPEEDNHAHLVRCIDRWRQLPPGPAPLYYPGEGATSDFRCSICYERLAYLQGRHYQPGRHVHACLGNALTRAMVQLAKDDFVEHPRLCRWSSCKVAVKQWDSADDFVAHVLSHCRSANLTGAGTCQWIMEKDEQRCGALLTDGGRCHIRDAHCAPSTSDIQAFYCIACAEWYLSAELHDWRAHIHGHYVQWFQGFQKRVSNPNGGIPPREILFVDDVRVEYAIGEGWGSTWPDLHGHVEDGICYAAMFCPFCVFDDHLLPETRMHQWTEASVLERHLNTHIRPLWSSPTMCPVPSCGTKKYDMRGLQSHLVGAHRLPVCGQSKTTTVRGLFLPKAPSSTKGQKRKLSFESSVETENQPRPSKRSRRT